MAKRTPIKAPACAGWPKRVRCLDGAVRVYATPNDWRMDAGKRRKEKSDGTDQTHES